MIIRYLVGSWFIGSLSVLTTVGGHVQLLRGSSRTLVKVTRLEDRLELRLFDRLVFLWVARRIGLVFSEHWFVMHVVISEV